MSVWSEVIIGFALVAGTYWLVKTIYYWSRFRRSIHIEIYSNFIEYSMRKKNISRLSESYYFRSEFGKHRIFYQLAQAKNEKVPQAYVILTLSSGIYVLNVKNQAGKIFAKQTGDFKQIYTEKRKRGETPKEHQYLLKNPMDESRYFEKKLTAKLGETGIPVKSLVVFPENSEIIWEKGNAGEIPVLQRKQMFGWIKKDFEANQGRLTEAKIDEIYHRLADESIEAEKNM